MLIGKNKEVKLEVPSYSNFGLFEDQKNITNI